MKLLFAGTRGEIDVRPARHRRHSSLIVTHRRKRILIDCGSDWLDRIDALRPDAIVLTHAHPDHAWGLKQGAPCAVYATRETWAVIDKFPITKRSVIEPRRPVKILGVGFEAFPVEHSIRAPAVGFRIHTGRTFVFYAPDVVYIHERHAALSGAALYIGDGASVTRPLIRKRGSALIGHAPIRQQLKWCADEHVPHAVFTHCGSEIVSGDHKQLCKKVRAIGAERGILAEIARDGLSIEPTGKPEAFYERASIWMQSRRHRSGRCGESSGVLSGCVQFTETGPGRRQRVLQIRRAPVSRNV